MRQTVLVVAALFLVFPAQAQQVAKAPQKKLSVMVTTSAITYFVAPQTFGVPEKASVPECNELIKPRLEALRAKFKTASTDTYECVERWL